MIRWGEDAGRRARAAVVVWGSAIAIAGTLGACGRYGPPQRSPSKAPAGATAGPAVGVPVGEPVDEPVGAEAAGSEGAVIVDDSNAADEPSDEETKEKNEKQ